MKLKVQTNSLDGKTGGGNTSILILSCMVLMVQITMMLAFLEASKSF